MKREELEKLALETVSPDNYYDLADAIDGMTDDELLHIIDANGDYEVEDEYNKRQSSDKESKE